jgi:dienelactone hydrolase
MKIMTLMLLLSFSSFAKVQTKLIEYKLDNTTLEGFLAFDDKFKGNRPAIMVVHEWNGIEDYTRSRVKQLAEMGYIAFAADIYGKGIRPESMEDAAKTSGEYKANNKLWRARAVKALEVLKSQKNVDKKKVAAIGYCFGGSTVLEMARAGVELQGVVSFHGNFATNAPINKAGQVKAKILVLHGAIDPFVKEEELEDFISEMKLSKADWQMISYGDAVHKFSNPNAGNKPELGYAYNKSADLRSWEAMKTFFKEIF